jgi:hypothetical protein
MQKLYVLDPGATRGELMTVTGAANGTYVPVARLDEYKMPHLSGALVLIQSIDVTLPEFFVSRPPNAIPRTTPTQQWVLDVTTGQQWLYSTVSASWVPGFNNTSAPPSPTAAVASAASAVQPSGPLFHITGTAAITGFTLPNGFTSGSFTVIPDGVFTWTTGDGSIALAGTAVVSKALTFTYDWNTSKWYPSYIA